MPKKSLRFSTICTRSVIAAIACLGLLITTSPALAHRLLVFAVAEGNTINTESKFVGGGPVQNGQVQVKDRTSGQVLATGSTNTQGKFSFPVPAATAGRLDLLIVVDGGMGHQGEWLLKAESYLAGLKSMAATASAGVSMPPASPTATSSAPVSGAKQAGLDRQAWEAALDKSLERHLAPIKEMLAEQSVRRTTLPDIIGGLGYIAGIFGLGAYFMSKKKLNP